jgi:hypothetical protein
MSDKEYPSTRWYTERPVERVSVYWRCASCGVYEQRFVDRVPGQWMEPPPFEHDWTFIDDGDVQGPVVCSKECAQAFAARLVERAYPASEVERLTAGVEETRRETARGVEATARAARNAGERARQAAYATRDAIRRRELP